MREYNFKVCFGDGRWANGVYSVKADCEETATGMALTEICQKLYDTLPELDIEVSVALEEEE